ANGVHILPVDSEHNAIFQCLESGRGLSAPKDRGAEAAPTFQSSDVRRIILTASGGPFRETPRKDFDSITPEQALKHPTWNMGPKITIDSATLFNKCLEMIEAHWRFVVGVQRGEGRHIAGCDGCCDRDRRRSLPRSTSPFPGHLAGC